MRPLGIVELRPGFDLASGVLHTQESMLIQTLLPQAAIERFDKSILGGLARSDKVDLDVVLRGSV